jgi:prophage antirepressor-like protein
MVSCDGTQSNLALSLTFPETKQQIRVMGTLDRPEWVAKDVCDVLGIEKPNNVLRDFDEDEKGACAIRTPGGLQEMLTVTEPGLYRLVLASRKPAAKMFKRWICHEVLPSIRLHGCYPPPPVPKNPGAIMLRQLADSLERQDHLEAQQNELAQRLEHVAGKVRDLDGDTGYITVLAYGRLKNINMPRSDAQRHGKALAAIHRTRGIKIGNVPDERHGQVHAYRIDVVEEYFADTSEGQPCQ